MTPQKISEASLALLNTILDEGHQLSPETPDLNSSRMAYCYRHGCNISRLGDDMLFLLSSGRFIAAKMVIRPMIESMFCISASYRVQTFHVEKLIAELENMVAWLTRDFPTPDKSIVDAIKASQTESDELKKRFGSVISNKKWRKIKDIAIAAQHERHYKKDYAYFCDYTHCGITGLLRQEDGLGISNALQTGTMTMLVTSSVLCGVLTIENKIPYLLRARELTAKLNEAIKSGAFASVDAKGLLD